MHILLLLNLINNDENGTALGIVAYYGLDFI